MAAAATAASDEQLVAAIRAGSDEALETLFLRYKDRIAAYVRGIVADQGKAEDIVQETFISALRNLRSTRQTIAFKPWIYQIARNACIDQLRRQKRAQEVSLDSDSFNVQDEGRISQSGPSTHNAVSQREDMHALRQAFGGLPDSQHEALVMRELEGLSYSEIASRLNVSPAAVESILFRARRGLKDEFDQIATGERCRRMQPLIAAIAEGVGGARDRRALARHVRFCTSCRREATVMGLGGFVVDALRDGRMKRSMRKVASLFPIPPFLRRRGGGGAADGSIAERISVRVSAPMSQLGIAGSPSAENAAGALSKVAAVAVAAALIGGGGVVGQKSGAVSASTSQPAGAAALSSLSTGAGGGGLGTGGPGQISPAGAGQAAPDPFGALGGLAQSGSQSGQITPSGQGSLIGPGGGTLGGGGLGGIVDQGGSRNPVQGILGGGLLDPSGSLGGSSSGDSVGDTIDKIVPDSVGGISVPKLPIGGSGGSGGGSSGSGSTGSIIDNTIKQLPTSPPKVQEPSLPSTSTPSTPALPVSPSAPIAPQVQQQTQPVLQAADQLTTQLPQTGLPLP
jgi:RNA polymerase sigma factor (sigma-70 family)